MGMAPEAPLPGGGAIELSRRASPICELQRFGLGRAGMGAEGAAPRDAPCATETRPARQRRARSYASPSVRSGRNPAAAMRRYSVLRVTPSRFAASSMVRDSRTAAISAARPRVP